MKKFFCVFASFIFIEKFVDKKEKRSAEASYKTQLMHNAVNIKSKY